MGSIARSLRRDAGLPGSVTRTLDNALQQILTVDVDDSPDVAGVTVAPVGLTVKDFTKDPIDFKVRLAAGIFRDAARTIPATGAGDPDGTFTNPTAGTIVAGLGTSAIEIETDVAGRFACDMNLTGGAAPQTLFFGPLAAISGSPVLDLQEFDSVTYDP